MKKNKLTKKILIALLMAGAIYIAASSPYFGLYLSREIRKYLRERKKFKEKDPTFNNAFYYLKNRGYLDIQKRNKQLYIALTEEGRKRAGKYLIDDLEIKKPKKWDKRWQIVIFDIPNLTNSKRAALRGKLKELGFYKVQKSVWVFPYDCRKEINLLQEFFGLKSKELSLITGKIENDNFLRRHFKI